MSRAEDNLKAAFAVESQAKRKYLTFAEAAEKEGFPQVARMFREGKVHLTQRALF